ncbi:MAG: hypothetical protein KOO66_12585 [Bacteroidales bacterium]|nr:hypothetical protein [Bacteroidales bacterium]
MKKIYLLLAAIILAFSTCNTPTKKPQATTVVQFFTFFINNPLVLNGKVKSVKYRTYLPINNNGTIEKGDLMTNEERDSVGFAYDFIAYFNEEGIIEKSELLDGDEVLSYWETEIEGQVFTLAKQVKNDTINLVAKYKYDENSHMVAIDIYRGGIDTLLNHFEVTTNEEGFVTEYNSLSKENDVLARYTFNVDENNRYVEQKNYNINDSLVFHRKRMHNDKGFHVGSKILVSSKYAGDKYKIEYTAFDEKGNWTGLHFYKNGELKTVEELVIEYYDN